MNLKEIIKKELTGKKDANSDCSDVSDKYADLLEPYRKASYPLSRTGTYLRVTKNFLENWVDINEVVERMKKKPILEAEIHKNPEKFTNSLREVMYEIGTNSYTPEWHNPKTYDHLKVIDKAAEGVVIANQIIGKELQEHAQKHFATKKTPYTILDVGPGNGSTTVSVISMIEELSKKGLAPTNYEDHIEIMLLDATGLSIDLTSQRLSDPSCKDGFTRPVTNITSIQSNFAEIDKDICIFNDSIDAIVSGGAIMHNTNIDPFFKIMYKLLRKDGRMILWDWSAGYTWAAPNLRVGKTRGLVKQGLYQIKEEDIPPIRDNIIDGWMGKHGLFGYHGIRYERLRKKLQHDFEKDMKSENGFNFIKWLDKNMSGKAPKEETPYHFIEGYGPREFYTESMKKAGFMNLRDYSFREIHEKHEYKKTADKIACSSALFFAEGIK